MFAAKIQQIKHAVPKGDKKRQKDAKAEIARLEDELKERHDNELKVGLSSLKLSAIFLFIHYCICYHGMALKLALHFCYMLITYLFVETSHVLPNPQVFPGVCNL